MNGESERVLVIDDNEGIREGCCRALRAAGYEVQSASNGQEALRIFREQDHFAAALIDLHLPGMDGLELTTRIHECDSDAVLLIITAFASIDTAVEATKKGAYGYLPKPFAPNELLLSLRNGLEKRALSLEARRLREERERNLVDLALERSKCNTIIQCMIDGVLVINRQRQIVLRNDAAGRLLDESAVLTLPYSLETLKCPDLISLCTSALEAQSSPLILSKEILLRDSAYMVIVSPVIETSGETAGVVVVLRDITALKKLETAKSMFVSMVAHEVKSPLAVAEGYLNLILSDKVQDEPEQRKKMLERSLLRIKTLRLMVSELLNLTAIETGNFTLKRSLMDIRKITAEAVNTCREMAEEKKITLTLESDDTAELDRVFADPDAMRIVLKNLIENAVKYTSDGGCVSVHVGKTGVFAKIKVKDNGIGIKPEDREKIFEEFYRAKNRHTAGIPGTGLGLSLVKRLLDLQHGRISVESTPEKGSEFTVSLPLTA